jgi:hypothetical protein
MHKDEKDEALAGLWMPKETKFTPSSNDEPQKNGKHVKAKKTSRDWHVDKLFPEFMWKDMIRTDEEMR